MIGEIGMKKIVYFLTIVFSVLFVVACKSTPQAGLKTAGVENAKREATFEDDEKDKTLLLDIYDDYHEIVLDGATEYTVKSGDTLSGIAKSNYGEGINGYYFPLIMFASKIIVSDPDKISPGQKLTIPDLQKNLDDKLARSHLKSMLLDIAFIYDDKADRSKGMLKTRNQRDRDGLVKLSRTL
jgi:hypothetical protein